MSQTIRKRNHLSSALALEVYFDLPVSLSDKMHLRHYFERYENISLESEKTGEDNWFFNFTSPWKQAVVHYFVVNYPQIDYTRIEDVLKWGIPSDALNRELFELRQARGY
ncbi:MAG: hypothetical protein AABX11_07295 [Nanoarchaeota archaeon]